MKKTQIIITIVLVLILGCIGTFAVLYFGTDTFKSDKQMFYKYISQTNIGEIIKVNSQGNYQQRLKSESYTNVGTIALEVKQDGINAIEENFNYDSKVDPLNKLSNSIVRINKSGENVLTVNYLRNEDLYCLKFEEIVNQYMIFENSNLKEFATKLGIPDTTDIPDKIDLNEILKNTNVEEINLEELKPIYDKYLNVIIESIPEEAYSKVEDGYELTIDLKALQKILVNVLTTLKDDQEVFNLLNSLISKIDPSQSLSFEEYQTVLGEPLEEISMELEENYNLLNIIAYKDGKIYVKINSYLESTLEKSEDEVILTIDSIEDNLYTTNQINVVISKKINTEESDQCNINIILKEDGSEVGNANVMISRNGRLDSNNIKNTILATIIIPSENVEMNLEYNNDKTFISNLEIEKINADDHLVINNLDKDQIQTLIINLGNLITEKTKLNPIEIIGAAGVGIISTVPVETQEIAAIGGVLVGTSINIITVNNSKLFEVSSQTAQETQLNMNNQMVQTFNSKFTVYEGTRRAGEIRILWTEVNLSNSSSINSDHIVTITGVSSLEEIDGSKTYNVSTRKDSEGYVNQIIIEELGMVNNEY